VTGVNKWKPEIRNQKSDLVSGFWFLVSILPRMRAVMSWKQIRSALMLSLCLLSFGAHAATFTWDGGGGNPFWSTGANWVGDAAPGAGDDLVFPVGAAQLTNNNDLGVTFNSVAIQASGYLLQGAAINVNNGITTTYGSGTSRIHSQVMPMTSQTFNVAAGGTLRFSTGINDGVTLTLDGFGTYLVDGVISGPGAVVVNNGSLVLDNTNTYSGGLTINGGTVAGSGATGHIAHNGGTLSAGTAADPTLATGNVTIAPGRIVQLQMVSPTAVQQLDVNGTFSMTDAGLSFGFTVPNTPAGGTVLTLVDNDGVDPISGTFLGMPEGSTFTVGGRSFRISYVGGDGNDITLIATETDLGVTKVADDTTPAVGQNATYTITVSNAGPTSATGVTLIDNLGAGLTYVSATPSQGSCSGTGPVTCNLGTINNGANATVTLVATASIAGPLVNAVNVEGDDVDPNPANDSDSETVNAAPAAPVAAVPALDARALAALALLLVVIGAFLLRKV